MPVEEWRHHTTTRRKEKRSDDFRLFQQHPIKFYMYRATQTYTQMIPEEMEETDVEEDYAQE
eukprot:5149692-Karenia_brevis.AAC.1